MPSLDEIDAVFALDLEGLEVVVLQTLADTTQDMAVQSQFRGLLEAKVEDRHED